MLLRITIAYVKRIKSRGNNIISSKYIVKSQFSEGTSNETECSNTRPAATKLEIHSVRGVGTAPFSENLVTVNSKEEGAQVI